MVSWAVGITFGASSVEKVTVCEVLADPLKYNGKMILLEGEIFGTDEGGWLTASGLSNSIRYGGSRVAQFSFFYRTRHTPDTTCIR